MFWLTPITRTPAQGSACKDLGRNGQSPAITPKATYTPIPNRAGSRLPKKTGHHDRSFSYYLQDVNDKLETTAEAWCKVSDTLNRNVLSWLRCVDVLAVTDINANVISTTNATPEDQVASLEIGNRNI